MTTHEWLGVGLRLLGAYFLCEGVFAFPDLWEARSLPADFAVPRVLAVALRILVGQRLLLGGARYAARLEGGPRSTGD